MAKANQTPPNEPSPLINLTDEARKHIQGLDVEIERVTGDLKALNELGLDTSKLQVHLDFATRAREVILERFT